MQEEKKMPGFQAEKPKEKETPHYVPDKEGHRRRRRHALRILIVCLLILLAIGLVVALPYLTSGAEKEQIVRIPHDATGRQLRDTLNTYFSPGYTNKVMRLLGVGDDEPMGRSGAFLVTEGMAPFRAARLLKSGAQHPVKLTINGFRKVDDLTRRIANRLEIDTIALRAALFNKEMLEKHGLDSLSSIALFLEATYDVYWDASPEQVIATFERNYDRIWNEQRQKKAQQLGLTPAEIMTLCSIVDEETLTKEEKGTIGRLYLNRIQQGMKLQADPTVRYALGDFTIRRVLSKHTAYDSPYNTYQYAGLPPGPIRTSSVETIDYVLDSKPNNYLYMCAKEDFSGSHNFAADYNTHLENARRYQNELNRRGIK